MMAKAKTKTKTKKKSAIGRVTEAVQKRVIKPVRKALGLTGTKKRVGAKKGATKRRAAKKR
jgi:hypothetical protein